MNELPYSFVSPTNLIIIAPDVLDYWGGKNALKILKDNEDWRLLTPIFLHAGVNH